MSGRVNGKAAVAKRAEGFGNKMTKRSVRRRDTLFLDRQFEYKKSNSETQKHAYYNFYYCD